MLSWNLAQSDSAEDFDQKAQTDRPVGWSCLAGNSIGSAEIHPVAYLFDPGVDIAERHLCIPQAMHSRGSQMEFAAADHSVISVSDHFLRRAAFLINT